MQKVMRVSKLFFFLSLCFLSCNNNSNDLKKNNIKNIHKIKIDKSENLLFTKEDSILTKQFIDKNFGNLNDINVIESSSTIYSFIKNFPSKKNNINVEILILFRLIQLDNANIHIKIDDCLYGLLNKKVEIIYTITYYLNQLNNDYLIDYFINSICNSFFMEYENTSIKIENLIYEKFKPIKSDFYILNLKFNKILVDKIINCYNE